jgi:hypothetical protein
MQKTIPTFTLSINDICETEKQKAKFKASLKKKNEEKKTKVPNKLKSLGFKKVYQDKDGFVMFGFNPSKSNKKTKKDRA